MSTGLTDECEMAFAIKKCAYAADPEVREHWSILNRAEYDQIQNNISCFLAYFPYLKK
jgi:hypothetical protein